MVRYHHRLNRHEFEQTQVVKEKPGVLQSMGSRSRTQLSDGTTKATQKS